MYRLLFMLGLILTSDMLQAAPTATDGNGPLVTARFLKRKAQLPGR